MNRITRFRAWVIKENRYCRVGHLSFDYNGRLETITCCVDEDVDLYAGFKPDEVVLEQFTGAYDKNDRKVYEGDVVKFEGIDLNFAVEYNEPCTKFWAKSKDGLVEEFENWGDEEVEVIGTIHDEVRTSTSAPAEKYPDFDKWDREAIDTPIKGLKVAPEDFYIEFGGKRKDYFTWDEAMEHEEKVLKPNGWRFPTCAEWYTLVGAFGVDKNGKDDHEAFYKALKMKRRGYVPDSEINEYNSNPDSGAVNNVGNEGAWWSSTATSASTARYLGEGSSFFGPQYDGYKGYGFAVRCVKEKNETI